MDNLEVLDHPIISTSSLAPKTNQPFPIPQPPPNHTAVSLLSSPPCASERQQVHGPWRTWSSSSRWASRTLWGRAVAIARWPWPSRSTVPWRRGAEMGGKGVRKRKERERKGSKFKRMIVYSRLWVCPITCNSQ